MRDCRPTQPIRHGRLAQRYPDLSRVWRCWHGAASQKPVLQGRKRPIETPRFADPVRFPIVELFGPQIANKRIANKRTAKMRTATIQSKWGRYCYRPHSYRCVVFTDDLPCDLSSVEHLASDVFPFPTSGLAVGLWRRFCHRRSLRHPVPSGFASCPPILRLGFFSLFRPVPQPIIPGGRSSQTKLLLHKAPAFSSMFSRIVRPTTVRFRVPLKRFICIWPKPSAHAPQGPRGQ